jgi:hypothetical protein
MPLPTQNERMNTPYNNVYEIIARASLRFIYTTVGVHAKQTLRQLRNILTILTTVTLLTSCGTDKKTEMTDKETQDNFDRQLTESMKDPLFALDLDSVKSKHESKFMELRTIINRHDPIGLLDIGAPDDEYESEVKTIIVQLDSDLTEQQVHDLVYQEFLRWFDDESTAGPKDAYEDLAKDIYDWSRK